MSTEKFEKVIESYKGRISSLRTNQADPSLLDAVRIPCYGSMMPLNQVASVSTSDRSTLIVTPFDNNLLKSIEKEIGSSNLGLSPISQGNSLRIPLPELTEERRKDLVKILHGYAEEAKVSIRSVRREEIDKIKQEEKNKELSEDESKKQQQTIQKEVELHISQIDSLTKEKEKSILSL